MMQLESNCNDYQLSRYGKIKIPYLPLSDSLHASLASNSIFYKKTS
ncbi:hypothetical protein SVI_1122 [Shewanella violacea DSS12]|uniref:Uncharacterized protein n=1 Tax=Shewanella violacea (strain JCM 10179 / CIP 106290 / LMG 19151 / DSS12) TaxID=637905 RepID=D4ZHE4_SHEVD|nr:hypothetical protein SVI_1122 [Shewanella violacea DSS12]